MSLTTKPLIGNSPEAVWHESNRRQQLRQRIVSSPDIGVSESLQGTTLFLKRPAGGSGSASAVSAGTYRLKDWSYADFLVCRELTADPDWDPDTDANRFIEGDADIYIAKPFWLRRSEFDGLTQTIVVESINPSPPNNLIETDTFWRYTYLSATFRTVDQLDAVGGSVLFTQNEIILPRFVEDEIITAQTVSDLQMQAFSEDIELEASLPGRMWSRAYP